MYATNADDALVPIFLANGPSRLSQVGTGVFVEIQSRPFLLTAAHVTDNLKQSPLLAPTAEGIDPIDGDVSYTTLLPNELREQDTLDVAFWRLSGRYAVSLAAKFKPLHSSRCIPQPAAIANSILSICGYPASRTRSLGEDYGSVGVTYQGAMASMETYQALGLDPRRNILIRFGLKGAIDPKTKKAVMPLHPRGVSGGAIFTWPDGSAPTDDWSVPKLCGIFHTFRARSNLMIGTSLLPILAGISARAKIGAGKHL